MPLDYEDANAEESRKQAQQLIDDAEPLTEAEIEEKEQLLQEVSNRKKKM